MPLIGIGRFQQGQGDRTHAALAVIDLDGTLEIGRHGACRHVLGRVRGIIGGGSRGDVLAGLQIGIDAHRGGGFCRAADIGQVDGLELVETGRVGVDGAVGLNRPAIEIHAGGIAQEARRVGLEIARAGEQDRIEAGGVLGVGTHHEEAVAVDRQRGR